MLVKSCYLGFLNFILSQSFLPLKFSIFELAGGTNDFISVYRSPHRDMQQPLGWGVIIKLGYRFIAIISSDHQS